MTDVVQQVQQYENDEAMGMFAACPCLTAALPHRPPCQIHPAKHTALKLQQEFNDENAARGVEQRMQIEDEFLQATAAHDNRQSEKQAQKLDLRLNRN